MYRYSVVYWVTFFFLYCLLGWIWESVYVSVRKRRWVNRGFLNGPCLPIYGFGAILVLFLTMPVCDNPLLVFLFGMLGATVLEYITGYVMEKLFEVKYWDYSDEKYNLKGYICLKCSIGWGFFSVMLVQIIHKPIEWLFFHIPETMLMVFDVVFLFLFSADVCYSTIEALDLKKILQNRVSVKQRLQNMQERLDALVLSAETNGFQEKLHERLMSRVKDTENEIARIRKEMEKQMELFEQYMEKRRKRAVRILKRNPGSISKHHKLSFEQIKEYLENNWEKKE